MATPCHSQLLDGGREGSWGEGGRAGRELGGGWAVLVKGRMSGHATTTPIRLKQSYGLFKEVNLEFLQILVLHTSARCQSSGFLQLSHFVQSNRKKRRPRFFLPEILLLRKKSFNSSVVSFFDILATLLENV
jgi:hypothetical protein